MPAPATRCRAPCPSLSAPAGVLVDEGRLDGGFRRPNSSTTRVSPAWIVTRRSATAALSSEATEPQATKISRLPSMSITPQPVRRSPGSMPRIANRARHLCLDSSDLMTRPRDSGRQVKARSEAGRRPDLHFGGARLIEAKDTLQVAPVAPNGRSTSGNSKKCLCWQITSFALSSPRCSWSWPWRYAARSGWQLYSLGSDRSAERASALANADNWCLQPPIRSGSSEPTCRPRSRGRRLRQGGPGHPEEAQDAYEAASPPSKRHPASTPRGFLGNVRDRWNTLVGRSRELEELARG